MSVPIQQACQPGNRVPVPATVPGEHARTLLNEMKGRLGAHHTLLAGGAHVHSNAIEVHEAMETRPRTLIN
jgi:hypothetical protein